MDSMFSDDDFEFIDESEVESTRRGRKPNPAAIALSQGFANMAKGQTVRIARLTATTEGDRIKNGNLIRSGATLAGRKVGIRWSPAGVPQVTIKA
jgi:hypothetical protein